MEIKQIYGNVGAYSSQQLQESQRSAQGQEASESSRAAQLGDKVALSPQARLLATTLGTANSASDVRPDKVRELKSQVQAGTYKPNYKKAAANMLRDQSAFID